MIVVWVCVAVAMMLLSVYGWSLLMDARQAFKKRDTEDRYTLET